MALFALDFGGIAQILKLEIWRGCAGRIAKPEPRNRKHR